MHLDKYMRIKGLNDDELAIATKSHRATIQAWRRGTNFPRRPQLMALCEVLGCSLDELVGMAKPKRNPVYRFAPELYSAVTNAGAMRSDQIHAFATAIKKLNQGRTTKTEVWLREIAEVVYSVEIMLGNRVPKSKEIDGTVQLTLF